MLNPSKLFFKFVFLIIFALACHLTAKATTDAKGIETLCENLLREGSSLASRGDEASIETNFNKYLKYYSEALNGKGKDYTSDLIFKSFQVWSSHWQVMQDVFGFKIGNEVEVPPVDQIIESYKNKMLIYAREGIINSEDILLPAFLVDVAGEKIIILSLQAIPRGGTIISDISTDDYNLMIYQGYFPVTETLFAHDLAHLTAFLEVPLYMANIKKLARQAILGGHLEYPARAARIFAVNENLILVRQEAKQQLLADLDLDEKMRQDLAQVNLEQMIQHLSQRSNLEIEKIVNRLRSKFYEYMLPLGGASRDGYSSYFEGYHHNGPVFRMINEFGSYSSRDPYLLQLARIQVVLIRLSQVSLNDWFEAIDAPFLDKKSPLGRLFLDYELWKEYPRYFEVFSNPYYQSNF